MIVGRFSVAPTMVRFGSYIFDPETSTYKVLVSLGDDGELVQSVQKEAEAKKLLAIVDECIAIREEKISMALEAPDE